MAAFAFLDDLDFATMRQYIFLGDGQAEAAALDRAAPRPRAAEERFEDTLAFLGGNTRTLVDDIEHSTPFVLFQPDMNDTLARRKLDGVCDEVVDHHAQLVGIPFHQHRRHPALETDGARRRH